MRTLVPPSCLSYPTCLSVNSLSQMLKKMNFYIEFNVSYVSIFFALLCSCLLPIKVDFLMRWFFSSNVAVQYNQYLNCRRDASPRWDLASPPLRYRCPPIKIWALNDRTMIRRKRASQHEQILRILTEHSTKLRGKIDFEGKTLQLSAKTFSRQFCGKDLFFGLRSILATQLRNLHQSTFARMPNAFGQGCQSVPPCEILQLKYLV